MDTNIITPPAVDGWNIDANPRNDPTYPMRDVSGDHSKAVDWPQPPLQDSDVEVLESVEYVRRPAVFGTSAPPSGLSGAIRRLAFKRSESDWRHWLLLIAADRVNVVEGIIEDLGKGRVPNIPAEMGLRAELQHNKPAFVRKATAVALIALTVAAVVGRRSGSTRGRKIRYRPRRR
jgi:hypothetical protein